MVKRPTGFTLIEVAVVVTVALLLLSLGLTAINAQLSSASYSTTKKRQDMIKDALIAYLGVNKRFPCPYLPVLGTNVTGIDTDPNPPSYVSPPAPVCASFGVVPFATLGLSREIAEDGWGNLFSYQVFSDPPPPPPRTCPGSPNDWGHSACFGEGKMGGLSVTDKTTTPVTVLSNTVVAVIVSHGANGLGAWAAQGTRNANPTTCEEAINALGTTLPPSCTLPTNTFYKGERQENDDVVAYLTANDALQPLVRQGAIKSATAKVNDDLLAIYDNALGTKLLNISTGSPGSPGSAGPPPVPATPPSGCSTPLPSSVKNDSSGNPRIDPWGNQYTVSEGPPPGTPGAFPISICSSGCALCVPLVAQMCKIIDVTTFDSYLGKQGFNPQC